MTSPIVRAKDLQFDYAGVEILSGVDFDVTAGQEWAVTGRSGSGKTTLLLLLAGLLTPSAGQLDWPELPAPEERRREIGVVFQAPSLLPDLTAIENVTLPLRLRGETRAAAEAMAASALEVVGMGGDVDAPMHALPAELSGGQQQRVAIARVLACRPRLVLADEPTGALDRETALRVVTALRDEVQRTGAALVLATHDEEIAGLLAARVQLESGSLRKKVAT